MKPGRRCAVALLAAETGRYLMQQRDDFAWIQFPGHWGCFGGTVEPGEMPDAALRRELREELGYEARSLALFTEFQMVLPFPEPRRERWSFSPSRSPRPKSQAWSSRRGRGCACFAPRSWPPSRASPHGTSRRS
jgi:8-oxo-dGTP pyrophosphatase MutT (NUDIX family)